MVGFFLCLYIDILKNYAAFDKAQEVNIQCWIGAAIISLSQFLRSTYLDRLFFMFALPSFHASIMSSFEQVAYLFSLWFLCFYFVCLFSSCKFMFSFLHFFTLAKISLQILNIVNISYFFLSIMCCYDQSVSFNKRYRYLLFAAELYEIIASKVTMY